MSTRAKIMGIAKNRGKFKTGDIVRLLEISRQTVAGHLKKLVSEGKLAKHGSTHSSYYTLPSKKKKSDLPVVTKLKVIKTLKGLSEDLVFSEVEKRMRLNKLLSKNVRTIAYYAFCEMLNNAIDHSRAKQAEAVVEIKEGLFSFSIRDAGIGIFANVRKGFKLASDYEAAEHVFKGKQTTDPERHSGQGIFFTSRIADMFTIRSHKLKVVIDNIHEDTYYIDQRPLKGTEVFFSIKQRSKKQLDQIFKKFSNDNFEFDRNEVRVKLSAFEDLLSRSQARRLLVGLDEYKRITFDFQGIAGIGQAFSDEIFRVYQNRHPKIAIDYINQNPAVDFMIKRTLK